MDIFLAMHDFVTSRIDPLKNIASLSYVDFPYVDIFYYTMSQITSATIITNLIQKNL